MKRIFADMHLFLNLKDSATAQQILKKAAALGYGLVSVPFSPEGRETESINLRKICNDLKMDFASRVDIVPRTRGQLMHLLRKLRRKFEVVCVVCENKEVARQAAKDRRVDLLSFPCWDYKKRFFDWAEAELASNSLAALEVDIKPLLLLEGSARIRLLATLRREISIAKEYRVPVIVSSGVETEMLLRKPREIAALVSLLSVGETSALDMVSTNPHEIVVRNREKLSRGFVAPGIRVIREGEDC
jgi:ribonuclease P/MRP protein subunit RPP1